MTSQRDRIRIDFEKDMESLFPGEPMTIGSLNLVIRPFGIEALKTIFEFIANESVNVSLFLTENEISWDNCTRLDNISKIAIFILDRFPYILEEASNIHSDDLAKLPPDYIVALTANIIIANMKAKENFEKNFPALTNQMKVWIPKLTGMLMAKQMVKVKPEMSGTETTQDSQLPSNN